MLGNQGYLFTHGRLAKKVIGNSSSVKFDGDWALKREEKKGDVLGVWHTHPSGNLIPSKRDIKTMKALVSCFGKPLFCVIQNSHKIVYLVSSTKHEKWETSWIRRPLVYKIFKYFRIYT